MRKFQCLLFVLKRQYICYNIICINLLLTLFAVFINSGMAVLEKHLFLILRFIVCHVLAMILHSINQLNECKVFYLS